MKTGRNIAFARKVNGMTQKELAARVGISREYLASIEAGKERPSKRVLARIAVELGVDIGNFMENK